MNHPSMNGSVRSAERSSVRSAEWSIRRPLVVLVLTIVHFMAMAGQIQAEVLAFSLAAPPDRYVEAEAIAFELGRIGIDVTVEIKEQSVLRADAIAGKLSAHLTDWGSAFFDPYDLAVPKLTTNARGNYSFYSNSRVDELMRIASSSTDLSARTNAYYEVQDIIFEDAPWAFGYFLPNIEGVSVDVNNYTPSMDTRINLHDVELGNSDTITIGMNTDAFQSMDPATFRGRETETVVRNMFDALLTRTTDGRVVPELAESWIQVDDLTYIFTLRNGPKFHNGDAVAVEDVVFTFERVLSPTGIDGKPSPRRDLLGPLSAVELVGTNQVRFLLSAPFPVFLQAIVHFQIVPKKHIQRVGDLGFASKPIGTGPFRFVAGDLKSEIIMERFPDYYGGSPMLPPVWPAKLPKVIFRCMPEPFNRLAALLAGEVDIIQAVPTDLIEWLAASRSTQILTAEGTRAYQIEFNTRRPPFDDVRVRRAVNHAIDWSVILSDIYNGYGERLATCFLPNGFGYNPDLLPYEYNPQMARQLLREAGYRDQ